MTERNERKTKTKRAIILAPTRNLSEYENGLKALIDKEIFLFKYAKDAIQFWQGNPTDFFFIDAHGTEEKESMTALSVLLALSNLQGIQETEIYLLAKSVAEQNKALFKRYGGKEILPRSSEKILELLQKPKHKHNKEREQIELLTNKYKSIDAMFAQYFGPTYSSIVYSAKEHIINNELEDSINSYISFLTNNIISSATRLKFEIAIQEHLTSQVVLDPRQKFLEALKFLYAKFIGSVAISEALINSFSPPQKFSVNQEKEKFSSLINFLGKQIPNPAKSIKFIEKAAQLLDDTEHQK